MRRNDWLWLALIFCCVLLLGLGDRIARAERVAALVLDGDTIKMVDGGEVIRLSGIDAPEKDQPHGKDAGYGLLEKLDDGAFRIEREGKGKYGRTIAVLWYQQKSVGTTIQAAMIRDGLAWVYPKYCTRPECESWRQLERIARERGKGLWANPDPIPPWEWRRR